MDTCPACQLPNKESQWTPDEEWKSCPRCSTSAGHHVFHPYPVGFGATGKRGSAKHVDGPQSWCSACRSGVTPLPGWSCAEVANRTYLDTKVPSPPPPLQPEDKARIGDIELTPEGRKKLAIHFRIERSRSRRLQFLQHRRLGPSGALVCDGCDIDFAVVLGADFAELVEVHHKVPLSLTTGPQYTRVPEDFDLLCPTCHKAVHYKQPVPMEVKELRKRRGLR